MNYKEKIDYSSLSTYIDCPRKFLFQYIMHFRGSNKSIDLIFGSCWHYGKEVVYKELMTNDKLSVADATDISIKAFNNLWIIEGEPNFPDEDIIFPKSPGHAANMYYEYWKTYLKLDQEDKKVIAVESPFTINLSSSHVGLPNYIGRLDLVFEKSNGSLEIMDHKTTKALWPTTFTGFEMSLQTDGYLTAGHIFYDKIPTMTYNMAICQKSKIAFHRYYIHKRKMQIEQFLQDLIFYLTSVTNDLDLMEEDLLLTNRNDHIKSFRRRPGYACTTYMRPCQFLDLCKMRNNPLLWKDRPPQGFSINEWDPEKHEEEMKMKLKQLN